MKRNLVLSVTLIVIIVASSSFIYKNGFTHQRNSGGVIGRTGSPSESNCSACHGGGGGVTSVTINANPAFISNQYISGQTYTIDVVVTNSSFSSFGFDTEVLTSTNVNAGTMTTPLAGVQFAPSGARKNATHTTPKSGVGTATFSFVWVAPVTGNATIYTSGNAVNGDASTFGDKVGINVLALTMNNPANVKQESKDVIGFNVFPNPVVSDLKINYSLVNSGNVKISVYNLQGKEVAELLNEEQSEGYHAIRAALPENLSQGVYFVKLNMGDKAPVQRFVVVQ